MLIYTRIFVHLPLAFDAAATSLDGERSLISIAYQNNMSSLRRARRMALCVPTDSRAQAYAKRIEEEIVRLGEEVLDVVQKMLLPQCTNDEGKVFYIKMQADYHRYLAELLPPTPSSPRSQSTHATSATTLYTAALSLASQHLLPTDPVRLGLLLNYSVFQYDILSDVRSAWICAKQAYDEALEELDTLSEEGYRNAVVVVRLLRDNLQTWLPEVQALDEAVEGPSSD
ncbi:14-3-3 protein [Exidia glandulosa HHB12029]|uniref:14-3-3 protein n=1 Tax=Exidia glandulosa HHB12029 TaxID=1314781 RepID=A0A165ZCR9_EXIGL|nr:14-3-3 protein [Exidia glandulosa HHB12029]